MERSVSKPKKLKTRMWKGLIALIVLALLFSLIKTTIYPILESLSSALLKFTTNFIVEEKALAVPINIFILVPVTLFIVVYSLGSFSDYLRLEKPLIKILSKKIPLVDIVRQVQENPESFVEVMFEWPAASGVFKKGVLIAEKEHQLPNGPVILCSIWEPRPISPGGEIYYVDKNGVIITGRNAAETIREISLGYGRAS